MTHSGFQLLGSQVARVPRIVVRPWPTWAEICHLVPRFHVLDIDARATLLETVATGPLDGWSRCEMPRNVGTSHDVCPFRVCVCVSCLEREIRDGSAGSERERACPQRSHPRRAGDCAGDPRACPCGPVVAPRCASLCCAGHPCPCLPVCLPAAACRAAQTHNTHIRGCARNGTARAARPAACRAARGQEARGNGHRAARPASCHLAARRAYIPHAPRGNDRTKGSLSCDTCPGSDGRVEASTVGRHPEGNVTAR